MRYLGSLGFFFGLSRIRKLSILLTMGTFLEPVELTISHFDLVLIARSFRIFFLFSGAIAVEI